MNAFGRLKLVTLNGFFREIPVKILDHNLPVYGFYARFKPSDSIENQGIFHTTFTEYKIVNVPLLKGDTETILKGQLIKQSSSGSIFGDIPASDVFWCLSGEHAKAGGSPTHLVRVSRRVWLAADIDDFFVVLNNNGIALVCRQPMRTVLTTVSKGSR